MAEFGSAYVFARDPLGVWNEVAKLTASNPEIFDLFGHSVSISGNSAIVGTLNADWVYVYQSLPNLNFGNVPTNLVSLRNAVDGAYVTLLPPPGTRLVDVNAVDPASIGNLPPGATFPMGMFEFTIEDVAAGETVTVDLIDHASHGATTYFKYGPTRNQTSAHWYDFGFDGSTGFQVAGPQRFTLTFVNGERGDSDLDENNTTIVDPGGPANIATQAPPTLTVRIRNDEVYSPGKLTSLAFPFSEDVSAILSLNDLVLFNQTTLR